MRLVATVLDGADSKQLRHRCSGPGAAGCQEPGHLHADADHRPGGREALPEGASTVIQTLCLFGVPTKSKLVPAEGRVSLLPDSELQPGSLLPEDFPGKLHLSQGCGCHSSIRCPQRPALEGQLPVHVFPLYI